MKIKVLIYFGRPKRGRENQLVTKKTKKIIKKVLDKEKRLW